MRVAVTGTPGTGKTTATDLLESDLDVVHLNEVVRDEGMHTGTDDRRGSLVADLEAVAAWLADRDDVLFESHLAHEVPADRVVVLRCHPEILAERLAERDVPTESVEENAEAEALDVVLVEAVERHGRDRIYEIDTTDADPEAVAAEIDAVVRGEREPSAGTVSYLDYL